MKKSTVEKICISSKQLKKNMNLTVYLPETYKKKKELPVLYFFHGRSGNEDILFHLSMDDLSDKLINNGEIQPMIIVCPNMDNSRGLNSSKERKSISQDKYTINLGMYEDYFIKEVIPFIDKKYNTLSDRKNRFIGGASAGGYIALHNGLRHQNLFSKVGGHMPAVELSLVDEDRPYFEELDIWDKYDPIKLAKDISIKNDVSFYLDAGDQDEGEFYQACSILSDIFTLKNISHENHIFPGNHSPQYILSNLDKYLKFYGSK